VLTRPSSNSRFDARFSALKREVLKGIPRITSRPADLRVQHGIAGCWKRPPFARRGSRPPTTPPHIHRPRPNARLREPLFSTLLEFRRQMLPVLVAILKVSSLIALPFVLLVGGSVWLHSRAGWPVWFALLLGAGLSGCVIGWYVFRLTASLNRSLRFEFVVSRVALPLVLVYCGYSLFYLSRVHAKSDEVRQYYTSVHPLLRVAISTATVFDRELVVTDLARVAADYDRMGLPRYENSLHFAQEDGYVRAVDLRTLRRAEWRNLFLRAYFGAMGFRTLRHVGTADHLHVSLPMRTR